MTASPTPAMTQPEKIPPAPTATTSSIASIATWLRSHPHNPSAYSDPFFPIPQPTDFCSIAAHRKASKRKTLGPISFNANAMPPSEKRRKGSPSKPNLPPFHPYPPLPRTPNKAAINVEIPSDDDATPRASDEVSSRSSKSSNNSNRSSSPMKKTGDLLYVRRGIKIVTRSNTAFPEPDATKALFDNLEPIFRGRQVIPNTEKAKHVMRVDDYNFGTDSNPLIPPQPPGAFSDEEVWNRAREVLYLAGLCEENSDSESAWNTEVHAHLLRLVLWGWREEWQVSYSDITTARIFNSTSATKMVDYAITIDPARTLSSLVTARLATEDFVSINHTRAECVRFKPIAISIETKRPGMEEDAARVQLGVWVSAHFERLQQLLRGGEGRMPILPLVLISGHEWRLKIASLDARGVVVLHGDMGLGDTRSILGLYTIMAALRHLCHWVKNDYYEWFVKNILQPTRTVIS